VGGNFVQTHSKEKKMKVLILWNTAGAFSAIAKWLNDNGHEARIVMREEFDPYEHTSHASDHAIMVRGARGFYWTGIKQILKFRPDIIHSSSSIKMLIAARCVALRAPIILSYHGSDVRYSPSGKAHPMSHLADFIHVTTQDLSQYGTWIDRVIDPMFYDRGGRVPKTALMYYAPHFYVDNRALAYDWCAQRGIKLTILDRSDPNFVQVPTYDMPELFSKFEYVLDWKGQKDDIYALSRFALEGLACGCKVIHDHDKNHVITTDNYELATVDKYINLYASLKKVSWWKGIKRMPSVMKAIWQWFRGKAEHYG
jgi:hypothetical protein